MTDGGAPLPDSLLPDPRLEAIELGLDAVAFGPPDRGDAATDSNLYLLLDAAADPDIPVMMDAFDDPARCLFDGQAFEDLGDVGPWLCKPDRHGAAWDWFVEDAWGRGWGIMIRSPLPLLKLKTRLKAFLRVEDEMGEAYFFKYFRPQHFLTYVPAFDTAQRSSFFRDIDAVLAEDAKDDGILHAISLDPQKEIQRHRHDLVAIGDPLIVRPPSPDDALALIRAATEAS